MISRQQYRVLHDGAGVLERLERGRLRLTGTDRRSYLQGLLTNDIVALGPGTGCYAAFLTPQGRMIADMRVFEMGDAVLMDLAGDLADVVRERFEQFIFSEDVHVADVTASLAHVGVYGPSGASVVSRALESGARPGEPVPSASHLAELQAFENRRWDFAGAPVTVACSDEIRLPGFDLFVGRPQISGLLSALRAAGAGDVSAEAIEVCRIEAGRPGFHRDMDEDTIPLEAGIEDRAISLTKGCYVGQEIIVRVLHRGHGRVARHLVGLTFDASGATPSAGDRIRAAEREIGTITSAAFSPALERPIAMGYVHRDFVEPGTALAVVTGDRVQPASVSALPFVGR